MDLGIPGNSQDFLGFPRISLDFLGFPRISLGKSQFKLHYESFSSIVKLLCKKFQKLTIMKIVDVFICLLHKKKLEITTNMKLFIARVQGSFRYILALIFN